MSEILGKKQLHIIIISYLFQTNKNKILVFIFLKKKFNFEIIHSNRTIVIFTPKTCGVENSVEARENICGW